MKAYLEKTLFKTVDLNKFYANLEYLRSVSSNVKITTVLLYFKCASTTHPPFN